ncbi:MAG: hypothetical protein IPM39_17645 [Chloroflexi bacterium]|nr:hypothetical protein [Chloroflexota bacterium]
MSQSEPYFTPQPLPFQPSPQQLERKAALHRFNRLFVYLPLGVVILVALSLIILLLVGVLAPGLTGAAEFASALADIIIILFSLPLMMICALGPAMLVGLIAWGRNRRQQGIPRLDDGGRIQELLWKLDSLVQQAQTRTAEITPKLSGVIIEFNARLSYLTAFLQKIGTYLKRS